MRFFQNTSKYTKKGRSFVQQCDWRIIIINIIICQGNICNLHVSFLCQWNIYDLYVLFHVKKIFTIYIHYFVKNILSMYTCF